MASANSQAKLVRAIRINEGDLYWCDQCEDWHPGEPEKLGEGFYLGKFPGGLDHGRVVGNRGGEDDPGYLYLLSDGTDYKTIVYRCVNGAVFDSEDWWAQDAGWKCTECISVYTEEDYGGDEEAKAMAEDCCRRDKDRKESDSEELIENKLTDPSVAYTTTNATTILSGTITSINEATGGMTISIEKLNEILNVNAPKPEVIPVDDVTADAFK